MSESIWTRERRLKDHESGVLHNIREGFKSLNAELLNDDWKAAGISAQSVMIMCIRMQEIEPELEGVTELVDGMQRIEERMDALEKAHEL